MEFFVKEQSIVRKIWGKSDTVLFIFAGAAAEFALNKAVDWLYFTGRLPKDPLGRLFSTVEYARKIVFSEREEALKTIDMIASIHKNVEEKRGKEVPDWAYRDVLFMLIDYSIRSWELLKRRLSKQEKEEVYAVFYALGDRMGVPGLPSSYNEWLKARAEHLDHDLERSAYTKDLFKQYRKHLGGFRFWLVLHAQRMLCPAKVLELLNMGRFSVLKPIVFLYRPISEFKIAWYMKVLLLPVKYRKRIKRLDIE
ncbi:oxygenase MpaB family protein [Cytophagaceae bacterium ABcell3]|nr:oxygenase MpaB family protein [Cytophagaceae bacterium ABcell3]